jgi:aminomethyltransferase
VAALALQGPTSAQVLLAAGVAVGGLKYFRVMSAHIAGVPVDVSRTGYTGDLGYEIWVPAGGALAVWDALWEAGRAHDLHAAGMLALDVARVEAGLLLGDVDFLSSKKALIDAQKYSPFEMGLGRLVNLDKRRFVGQAALIAEKRRGPWREVVGLEVDWDHIEAIHDRLGLPPAMPAAASRVAVPIYDHENVQVGKATTTAWSPTLKKLIALATVRRDKAAPGTRVLFEITVEAVRHRVPAQVVKTPFFNPPRKTATPAT